jgi:hypothetical protein
MSPIRNRYSGTPWFFPCFMLCPMFPVHLDFQFLFFLERLFSSSNSSCMLESKHTSDDLYFNWFIFSNVYLVLRIHLACWNPNIHQTIYTLIDFFMYDYVLWFMKISHLLKGCQNWIFFLMLKVANIRCFILIAVEIFHNIIRK